MNSYLLTSVLLMGLSISYTAAGTTVNRPKEGDSFTINRGKIFHISAEQTVSQVKGLNEVAEILVFKDSLIARDSNGSVYLLDDSEKVGKGDWFKLVGDTLKIATDGTDLYALVSKRSLWNARETKDIAVFNGTPGDLMWTFTSVPVACGPNQMCMSGAIPTLTGRQVSFRKMNLRGVADLTVEDGQIVVVSDDGAKAVLSKE